MSATRALVRASLDLRGIRPSEEEFEAVEADPGALDGLLDDFVQDDRFPDRLISLYHEVYLTQTEGIDLRPNNLEADDTRFFYWEVGQEPLQIIAEVAREDLPYTTIVTADWTMANEDLAAWFPVEWTEGDTGWKKTRYTDGRPAGGVIATNGLWWRYTTTEANANRRRANALTRILVCADYLQRPIAFDQDINLLDEAAISDALHQNPTCVNCHVSLDPIAAHLFGFYWTNFTSPTEGATYHAGKETMWEDLLGTPPGWFGTPTRGFVDLGAAIAADERFPTCAVQQAFERMLRRDATVEDTDDLVALREDFISGDMRLKSLYRDIVDLDVYRAGDVDSERGVPIKMMTPDVLAASVQALTGFSWMRDEIDLMRTDQRGLRALAGGVEGVLVKRPSPAPGATVILSQAALAEEAAQSAMAEESALAQGDRRLFTEVDFTETPDTDRDAFVAQLQRLTLLALGRRVAADAPEIDDRIALWEALYAQEGSIAGAWQGVLIAFLRDPEYLLY